MIPLLRMAITYMSPWRDFEGHLVSFLFLLTERSRIRESALLEVGHISVNSKRSWADSPVYKLGPVTCQWPKIRYFSLPGSCKQSIVQKGEIVTNDIWQSASCTSRQTSSYYWIILKMGKLINLANSESVPKCTFCFKMMQKHFKHL